MVKIIPPNAGKDNLGKLYIAGGNVELFSFCKN